MNVPLAVLFVLLLAEVVYFGWRGWQGERAFTANRRRLDNGSRECVNAMCLQFPHVYRADEHNWWYSAPARYIARLNNGFNSVAILFYDRHGNVCEAIHGKDDEWEVRRLSGGTEEVLVWPGGLTNETSR
jgi:hypothetical protein